MAPIHEYAKHGDVAHIRELLHHNAPQQVLLRNADSMTPLMVAVHYQQGDAMRALLEHIPNTQVMMTHLVQEIQEIPDTKYMIFVSDQIEGVIPLMVAAVMNFVDGVDILLDHIPHEQVTTIAQDWNALMYAAFEGSKAGMEALLRFEADEQMAYADDVERTALTVAAWKSNYDCVRLLIEAESPWKGLEDNHLDYVESVVYDMQSEMKATIAEQKARIAELEAVPAALRQAVVEFAHAL